MGLHMKQPVNDAKDLRSVRMVLVRAALAILGVACASHPASRPQPQVSPAALSAVHADLRLVNGETTWVTHGKAYELVGRSKTDLAMLQPPLDGAVQALQRVFPGDSLSPVIVTVRRLAARGKPFVAAAPVPTPVSATVVEAVLSDPRDAPGPDNGRRAPPEGMRPGGFGERSPILPAVRAWLSSHATRLTQHPARFTETDGEVADQRVPAWAESMIPALGSDSVLDRFTMLLAAHPENLIPLSRYFTMERPAAGPVGQRGSVGGDRGGEGGAGRGGTGGSGRGGVGGMGGGRSRGGIGGRGGGVDRGSSGRSEGARPMPALQGAALFDAQSLVLGHYLSRQGYDLIGTLVDAQILGRSVDEVFAKRSLGTPDQMEVDWRRWLLDRATAVERH
jgi:hypothetical protein